jgi:N-acetylneuraminic acid mutarotase
MLRVLLLCIFLVLVCFSCKKEDIRYEAPFEIEDSLFFIKSTPQLDLNEFGVEYYLNALSGPADSYGLEVRNLSDPRERRYIRISSQPSGTLQFQRLDTLKGASFYLIRLAAIKGKDTTYSLGKEIKTDQLKFVGHGQKPSFHRPLTSNFFYTNLPDSNRGVHSKIFIDNIECPVTHEDGKLVHITNDADITPGYHTITIKRKGLEAKIDSAYFYFGKWKKLNDFTVDPNPAFNRPNYLSKYGVFHKANKGYMFGGVFSDYLPHPAGSQSHPDYFMEYDPSADSWTRIPYSVPIYFLEPKVHVVNDEAYVVNGFVDTTRTNGSHLEIKNVYKFDLANRRWVKNKAIPAHPRARPVSFSGNDRIYLGLGSSTTIGGPGGALVDLWEYNPTTDSWLRKADFPGESRMSAGAFVIGTKAYVFGGYHVGQAGSEMWEYDMVANSWRQIRYPGRSLDPYSSAVGFSHEGKGYIVGGWTHEVGGLGYYNAPASCYRFDPVTETFQDLGFAPGVNVHGGVLFQSGNKFILTGMELSGDGGTRSKNVTEFRIE